MLYLSHDNTQHPPTPLNDLERLMCELTPDEPPRPVQPKKPAYDYRVQAAAACETNFRHSHWKARRARVLECLASAGESTFALDRFTQCGAACTVEHSRKLGRFRLRASYCKCRHCEPCMRAKANKIAANLKKRLAMEPDGRYRFITLTLRHNRRPLHDQIRRLYACFKKLRASRAWQESQRGGAAMLEVKYNKGTGHWHPHLHVIGEGAFLRKDDLSKAWHKATGDSMIADIRAISNAQDAAQYVCKYVSKGTSLDVWDVTSAAQEWIIAAKGVRTLFTYGTWRGYQLLKVTDDADDWQPVATLVHVYACIEQNEEWAIGLMNNLSEKRVAMEKHKPPQAVLFDN